MRKSRKKAPSGENTNLRRSRVQWGEKDETAEVKERQAGRQAGRQGGQARPHLSRQPPPILSNIPPLPKPATPVRCLPTVLRQTTSKQEGAPASPPERLARAAVIHVGAGQRAAPAAPAAAAAAQRRQPRQRRHGEPRQRARQLPCWAKAAAAGREDAAREAWQCKGAPS